MKHVIVLPYYCSSEIASYLEMAHLWKDITDTQESYEFFLSSRYDKKFSPVLKKAFARIAPTCFFRCRTRGKGIIRPSHLDCVEGPTAMFWDTMEYIQKHYDKDGGFVLWFEADMLPVHPQWLNRLSREWREGTYLVMGRFLDQDWLKAQNPRWGHTIRPHINGGACYSKDFYKCVPKIYFNLSRSWDEEIYGFLKHHYSDRIKKTDLIEFRYLQKTMTTQPLPQSMILHGIKDQSARKYVCEMVGKKFKGINLFNRLLMAMNS